jgi:hypothetical protein
MKPVFIGGAPRSGTTLLGAMLSSHSVCCATPESQFKTTVYRMQKKTLEENVLFISNDPSYVKWDITIDSSRVLQNSESYPSLIFAIVQAYFDKIGKSNAEIWVDHTGENIERIPTLHKLFPDMKLIHLIRDGRAVMNSILKTPFGPNTPSEAALMWQKRIAHGLAAEGYLGQGRYLRVHYENLITSPDIELRRICRFIDVPFEEIMIAGKGFSVPLTDKGYHENIGKGIRLDRINAWADELPVEYINVFHHMTKDLLLCMGYDIDEKFHGSDLGRSVGGNIIIKLLRLRSKLTGLLIQNKTKFRKHK